MEIPEYYKPTKKTLYFVSIIIILAIVIPFFNFTFNSLNNFGEFSKMKNISFGYPLPFMVMQLTEINGSNPIKIWNFFIDLTIYCLLAYLLDLIINFSWITIKEKNKAFDEWSEKRSKRITEKKLLKKQTL